MQIDFLLKDKIIRTAKRTVILVAVISVLFSVGSQVTREIVRFAYSMGFYDISDIQSYKKSFRTVADRLAEIYDSEKEKTASPR